MSSLGILKNSYTSSEAETSKRHKDANIITWYELSIENKICKSTTVDWIKGSGQSSREGYDLKKDGGYNQVAKSGGVGTVKKPKVVIGGGTVKKPKVVMGSMVQSRSQKWCLSVYPRSQKLKSI